MAHTPKNNWSEEQKANLRNRILTSAKKESEAKRRRKKRLYYTAAASCIPLVLALVYFMDKPSEPTMEDFVKTLPENISKTDKVTVVLGQGEQITIEEDEGHVEYSKTGSSLTFGSGKKIEQPLTSQKEPIFNTILVPYGKRGFIKLSDNTKVWINSGSKLVFPAVFSNDQREVYLEGEAIFEVAHNKQKPFRVRSNTQEIEVLGTVFNISHYSEDTYMKTVLKSGSIKITYREDANNSFLIKPGTLSSFDKTSNKVNLETVNPDHYFSWRHGYLTLSSSSLEDITSRLSRYYNHPIHIEGEALAALTFSGKLDLTEELDDVLEVIKETRDFQIVAKNGSTTLTLK